MILFTCGGGYICDNIVSVFDWVAGCKELAVNFYKRKCANSLHTQASLHSHTRHSFRHGVIGVRRLVEVLLTGGAVYVVGGELRSSSSNFGKCMGVELTGNNKRQLWVQQGFTQEFVVTSESAEFLYNSTDYCYPKLESSLLRCHSVVVIQWPFAGELSFADKDATAIFLKDVECLK